MLERFTKGPADGVRKLNELVNTVNKLERLIGDGIIKVNHGAAGTTIGVDIDQLMARMPKTTGGGSIDGLVVKEAIAQEDAPAGTSLSVKLCDDDGVATGSAFDVTCFIHNGTDLDEATPYIESGKPIFVARRGNGTWVCVSPIFQAMYDGCVCCS